jgi:hypothetical protein
MKGRLYMCGDFFPSGFVVSNMNLLNTHKKLYVKSNASVPLFSNRSHITALQAQLHIPASCYSGTQLIHVLGLIQLFFAIGLSLFGIAKKYPFLPFISH